MPTEVILPKVDMDMATGQISRWFVDEGAAVKQGDLLFEIETDKAAMEIDSPAERHHPRHHRQGRRGHRGRLAGRVDLRRGRGVCGREGRAVNLLRKPKPSASGRYPIQRRRPHSFNSVLPRRSRADRAARPLRRGRGRRGPRNPACPPAGARKQHCLVGRYGFGPARTRGEGRYRGGAGSLHLPLRGGRAEGAGGGTPEVTPPAPPTLAVKPMSDDAVLKLFEEGSYELVPHDNMRKTIARRLVEAKSTIPHFYLTLDCEIDALLALRTQINAAAPVQKTEKGEVPAYKLSVNDMVIKAMALALRDVPTANVSWTETAMVQHKHADVGVAVSIPGGLITPIIRHADDKTLSVIANEMKDLAGRARNKKLKPEEYQGGTTAVSNLGMFGIKDFSAVINPPHATILAVGAGEERAVVKNGEIKIATIMSVTLSTDHRAVDGALGAELLVAFKRRIENPLGMLV